MQMYNNHSIMKEYKENYLSLAGGGAIEMELSKYLRNHSRTIAGKEQLLIGALAKALEVIPRQLCENAGFDATNILNKLRQSHAQGKHPSSQLTIFPTPISQSTLTCIKENSLYTIPSLIDIPTPYISNY